jgi:hypothetical protein
MLRLLLIFGSASPGCCNRGTHKSLRTRQLAEKDRNTRPNTAAGRQKPGKIANIPRSTPVSPPISNLDHHASSSGLHLRSNVRRGWAGGSGGSRRSFVFHRFA